ncbi:homeotic protein ultrabithorax-like [Brevipalpus obovatus]|uniref:homeotic protein ultrabithorax-like n=1 Tax=Brevipalpus obovatus TaxID=246614 RepID=UPI003D9DBE67
MINSYSDFGFYGTGSQPVETQAAVAYRLGGLSLNTGYQNRMVQNGSSTQNYVDSKPYDQMSCHHSGGQEGDNLVKESQNNFKTPDQHPPPPPPTTTVPGAWNGFNSMRPTTSPASSLTSIPSGDNMRFDPAMAYARSMQNLDMYSACCQSNQVMNPGIHQNILPWVNNMVGPYQSRRRGRQTYSRLQTLELEKEFHTSIYLTRKRRIELSSQIGLSERQIKIWFQNRRMKKKKESQMQKDRKEQLDSLRGSSSSHPTNHHSMVTGHSHTKM